MDWNTLGATLVDHLLAEVLEQKRFVSTFCKPIVCVQSFCVNRLDKKYGDPPSDVAAVYEPSWQ